MPESKEVPEKEGKRLGVCQIDTGASMKELPGAKAGTV